MTEARVVVIGGGLAGLAAAWSAHRSGARVTLVRGAVGASSLMSGAVDREPWDERERAARILGVPLSASSWPEDEQAFADALGLWSVPRAGDPLPRLATTSGRVRTALAHDHALLDLGRAKGRVVLVPRAGRAGWDADSIVRCLGASSVASDGTTFEAIDAPVLRFEDELRASDGDVATRHEETSRIEWLAMRLAPAIDRVGRDRAAVLLGPWLGARRARALELSAKLGLPAGEVLSPSSVTPGLRFEAARDTLLESLGVRIVTGRATQLRVRDAEVRVDVADLPEAIGATTVVLATGGLVGGGIVYEPSDYGAGPEGAAVMRSPFRLSLDAPEVMVQGGSGHLSVGSTHGPVLDATAWPTASLAGDLERAGVRVDDAGRAAPRVFACGDVVVDRPRTAMVALRSALTAGSAAAARL